ncbi:MATE family efflux transporter [Gilvimarinus agarilyticus]|uniref:MATE family efflux transporter n=1 Tax=Gilvimarinus agarilyticus TaxID=679259 RepID=UPI000695D344|nr:MATE family efflux transporter [Gilvimarinus agarilyticus]
MSTPANAALGAPVLGTFLRYVGASVAGLLALTGAAIIDGFMVGKWLGAEALAAVNLLIPLWILLFGLVLMLAIGASVVASRYLGAGRLNAASKIFSATLSMAAIGGLALTLIFSFLNNYLLALLAVPESLQALVRPYFLIVLAGLAPQYVAVVLYYFLRVAGEAQRASRALVLGALVNIILDILLLGVLHWDIRAAALATLTAQLTQCALLLVTYRRHAGALHWRPAFLKTKRLLQFCANGFSEFVNEVSAGIVLLIIHWLLSREFGVAAVAGFALIHYALLLNIMLACAIAEVVHVLVSQNNGAGQTQRSQLFFRLGLGLAVVTGIILWCFSHWGSQALSQWFFSSVNAAHFAQQFWPVIAPVFLLTGANLVISAWFTAQQRPGRSALIALSRSLVLPLFFLWLLYTSSLSLPFLWALPFAELFTLLLAGFFTAQHSSLWRAKVAFN